MQEILFSKFIQNSHELWAQATDVDFLTAIEEDTISPDAFQQWLEQDYHFVKGLLSAQAIMTSKTPRPSQSVLIRGLAAMDHELNWFEDNASKRGYNLQSEINPVCQRYIDYLMTAAYNQPYEVNLAVIFGVEVAYLAGWSSIEAKGPYEEFIRRWSNPEFVSYVKELQQCAEENPHPEQQKQFDQVLRHERDFWRMTMEPE